MHVFYLDRPSVACIHNTHDTTLPHELHTRRRSRVDFRRRCTIIIPVTLLSTRNAYTAVDCMLT